MLSWQHTYTYTLYCSQLGHVQRIGTLIHLRMVIADCTIIGNSNSTDRHGKPSFLQNRHAAPRAITSMFQARCGPRLESMVRVYGQAYHGATWSICSPYLWIPEEGLFLGWCLKYVWFQVFGMNTKMFLHIFLYETHLDPNWDACLGLELGDPLRSAGAASDVVLQCLPSS